MQTLIRSRSTQILNKLIRGGDSGHHYKGYNEPTGDFLGIPRAPEGYKRKKLWFENMYYYLFGGTWLLFSIGLYYRPKDELESWAEHEAKLRIQERGQNWNTPNKPY